MIAELGSGPRSEDIYEYSVKCFGCDYGFLQNDDVSWVYRRAMVYTSGKGSDMIQLNSEGLRTKGAHEARKNGVTPSFL